MVIGWNLVRQLGAFDWMKTSRETCQMCVCVCIALKRFQRMWQKSSSYNKTTGTRQRWGNRNKGRIIKVKMSSEARHTKTIAKRARQNNETLNDGIAEIHISEIPLISFTALGWTLCEVTCVNNSHSGSFFVVRCVRSLHPPHQISFASNKMDFRC